MLPCWQRKPKEGVIVGMHVTHIIGFLSHMLLRHFDPVQTTMAYIRDDHIVDIPSVSMRVPPNPLLGYDKRATAPPSTAATSTAGLCQSTLAHRVLLYDQRCLITGAASNQLQACHLINTICMDKSNQGEKLCIKKDVVCSPSFLTHLAAIGTSHLGTYPHPATVWDWRIFLGQLIKLYFQSAFFCLHIQASVHQPTQWRPNGMVILIHMAPSALSSPWDRLEISSQNFHPVMMTGTIELNQIHRPHET